MLPALFAIYLASESIRFDADLLPRFSEQQVASTSRSTREGLVKWAATAEGRSIIAKLVRDEYEVTIVEDANERGVGRAPQPATAMLVAYDKRNLLKRYRLVVNPSIAAQYDNPAAISLGHPRTAADVMAAAWAAEMLHIDFYARGIPLPHHERDDFQQRWLTVASQLGFPMMEHGTKEEERGPADRDPVITIGEPRTGLDRGDSRPPL
jgi:hypothetical protein